MSKVFFISDLHLGDNNILNHAQGHRYGETTDEHDHWLVTQWNSVVTAKKDVVYVLGDVCFDLEKLKLIDQMKGNKVLLMGNHDRYPLEEYQKYFYKIIFFQKYKGFWLSHCPIHPEELRGKNNIHGHVHLKTIQDTRYINVCVEALNGTPIEFNKIKERFLAPVTQSGLE